MALRARYLLAPLLPQAGDAEFAISQVCEELFGDSVYHSYAGSTSADEVTATCNGDAYGGACRTGATAQPDSFAGTRCATLRDPLFKFRNNAQLAAQIVASISHVAWAELKA